MPIDPQSLYLQIGRMVETFPDNLHTSGRYDIETVQWLGRCYALVERVDRFEANSFKLKMDIAVSDIGQYALQRRGAIETILAILYRCLATSELEAPAAVQGAFIPVGNSFDALTAFAKAVSPAKVSVLIIDPYMDEKTLMDFVPTIPESAQIHLLTDAATVKAGFEPALTRWISQNSGRHLEARLASPKTLHDRLIVIDSSQVWLMTQSLNAMALRSPASIVRMDGNAGGLKIEAFEGIWNIAAKI